MSAGLTDESSNAERELLRRRLEEFEFREVELAREETRLLKELEEVRKQSSYYGLLNRDMKKEAVRDQHRPFLDMSRSLR